MRLPCAVEVHVCCEQEEAAGAMDRSGFKATFSNKRENPRRKAVASGKVSPLFLSSQRESPRRKAVASRKTSGPSDSRKRESPRHKAVASFDFSHTLECEAIARFRRDHERRFNLSFRIRRVR